jgi:hypothetical protein
MIGRVSRNSMGVYLMGVYLIGVYLMGVCLMGVYLTGVHLMGVYHTGVYLLRMHVILAGGLAFILLWGEPGYIYFRTPRRVLASHRPTVPYHLRS